MIIIHVYEFSLYRKHKYINYNFNYTFDLFIIIVKYSGIKMWEITHFSENAAATEFTLLVTIVKFALGSCQDNNLNDEISFVLVVSVLVMGCIVLFRYEISHTTLNPKIPTVIILKLIRYWALLMLPGSTMPTIVTPIIPI